MVVIRRRRRSRSKSRRIRRIRRGTGRGRLVITGPKNEWPAWLWVNQAISNCERSNCQVNPNRFPALIIHGVHTEQGRLGEVILGALKRQH